jgi:predicted DNA-binding transcriptional regulator YafY
VHHKNTWYPDGWCHRTDCLRRFSLDAIGQADLLDTKAKDVGTKALQAEMDAGYGIYAGAERHWATLSFDGHAAQWISQEEWHPEQAGRWTDKQRYELKIPFVDETELVMDVLRHGGHVKVVSPPSLKALVQKRLQEALVANAD